jgi:hypothetical protein
MEVMIESLHHMIDQLAGVLLALLSQVEIKHGGFEPGMAHVALDDTQIDAGFEEMGGVGMAQGVDRNPFFAHASVALGTAKSALDAAFGHGIDCRLEANSVSAKGREEKTGVAVGAPVTA